MTSGERIRILRVLCGYTQQSLADIAGVSRASVMLWEKGKLPTRRTAVELAALFEVSAEFLLDGLNPPTYALWQPIPPGHPRHLSSMSDDIKRGLKPLFNELQITFAAKGTDPLDKHFWLLGSSPEQPEWKLNYLLLYDKSLDTIITQAISASVQLVVNLDYVHYWGGRGDLVDRICEELYQTYGHHPNCQRISDRLGGLEGEGEDDFTLEGLLRRFGMVISSQCLAEDDVEALAHNLAREVSLSPGVCDIKGSATRLLRSAMKKTKLEWQTKVPQKVPRKTKEVAPDDATP